jgi:AsmA protein
LAKFRVEEFLEPLKPKQAVTGLMDFFVKLSLQGKTRKALQQTAVGEASLRGANLTLVGRDLDRELARYDSTQNFNLVDAGALFFAGPMGLALTKGYDFANLFRGQAGSSPIRMLVSEWRVEHGVAEAKDVAMATNENRLALHGSLDFVNQRYAHVTVAIVDAQGCTLVRQKIRGPFRKPVVEKPNIIRTIAGPAVKLLTRTKEIFTGRRCELFYSGSVTPSG